MSYATVEEQGRVASLDLGDAERSHLGCWFCAHCTNPGERVAFCESADVLAQAEEGTSITYCGGARDFPACGSLAKHFTLRPQ